MGINRWNVVPGCCCGGGGGGGGWDPERNYPVFFELYHTGASLFLGRHAGNVFSKFFTPSFESGPTDKINGIIDLRPFPSWESIVSKYHVPLDFMRDDDTIELAAWYMRHYIYVEPIQGFPPPPERSRTVAKCGTEDNFSQLYINNITGCQSPYNIMFENSGMSHVIDFYETYTVIRVDIDFIVSVNKSSYIDFTDIKQGYTTIGMSPGPFSFLYSILHVPYIETLNNDGSVTDSGITLTQQSDYSEAARIIWERFG